MNTIHTIIQDKILLLLIVYGIIFGIMAAIAAFVNAYEGYSHFPEISKTKRIRLSLSIALGAFCVIVAGMFVAMFFFR